MALIDELAGVLGADEIAKIKANPRLAERMTKVDEVYNLYYGEEDPAPTPQPPPAPVTTHQTPPASTGGDDMRTLLSGIHSKLDKVLTPEQIDERVTKAVTDVIEKRAPELLGQASKLGLQRAIEWQEADLDHRATFGTPLDKAKFNEFLEAQKTAGRVFANLNDAYQEFTREPRTTILIEKKSDEKMHEKLKARAAANLPGVTPTGARTPLSVLMARGRPTSSEGQTTAETAGEMLRERLARANAE